MTATISLDNIMSISELSHGGVSKAVSRVEDGNPIVVMRNNKPAAIIISPDDYRMYTEAKDNLDLYVEASERMNHDDGTRLNMNEVFGKDYKPMDDGFEPELD